MTSENKHKSVRMRSIVASVCLLVMFIGAIFFFIHANSSATSTTIATPTKKKATPIATPTAITPTALLTPEPLFFDDFSGASKGWSLGNGSGYTRTLDNSTLTLAATNHKLLTESLPTSTSFNDFMITVTYTLLQAASSDSVGLYLRGDSYLDHDYRIDIYGNSSYAISKEYLDESKQPQVQFLVNPVSTPLLKPVGQENTITAVMKGPVLVLLINGRVVHSVVDPDYTNGQIALFVQNSDISDGVSASFSSVVVYPAPEQLPGK